MNKYYIDDLQGGGFCEWSYNDPPNRAQIVEHFDGLRINECMTIPKKALTLKNIARIWSVNFRKA